MNPAVRRGVFRSIAAAGILLLVGGMVLSHMLSASSSPSAWQSQAISPSRAFTQGAAEEKRRGPAAAVDAVETLPVDPEESYRGADKPAAVVQPEDRVIQPGMKGNSDVKLKFPRDQSLSDGGVPDAEALRKLLLPGMIPPDVHYVWCGENRWFEFKHYLSVLSVLKLLTPDSVTIHYQFLPSRDNNLYNLWMDDLKRDYTFLILQPLTEEQHDYCTGDFNAKIDVVLKLLNFNGGIFVSENTWVLDITPSQRLADIESALTENNGAIEGFLMMQPGLLSKAPSLDALFGNVSGVVAKKSSCGSVHHMVHDEGMPLRCLVVKGGLYDRFWPMDIWELNTAFGRLTRRIFYGTDKVLRPEPSYDTLVPNIGHMVWIGGGAMDFVFYLSVLSMLYVAEVETVFIHGDLPIQGEYWRQLQSDERTAPRVKFIKRTAPSMVFQGAIEPYYRALMSDIIRVDLMIKYGGIYTDTDAIWAKPLTYKDRGYDAVASFDWVDWSWPYPDSVNFGISYGKKNAPFWQIFRESMRELHNDLHGFTGVMMPYRLLEKYPHLLRIDRHLQVICYYSRCHPLWVKDYHNMTVDHVSTGSLANWRQDINTFHWTYPNPPELSNRTALLSATGIFADLGKAVLEKAGLL